MTISNDIPITEPDEDLYSLDPFARAVARSIEAMEAPEGVVLAINGPWGSGKSSAINLISRHLQSAVRRGDLVPVVFNPWWFAGADALTLAFFRELSVALGQTLSDKVRNSLSAIGGGVSALGPVIAAAANLKAPGLGSLLGKGASLIGKVTKQPRTVDQEHIAVANALRDQKKRFLVVIDDIDRLSPDDALTIFRLVKSVGRLPNVIYLLSFDRALAERAVAERFPSEGPSYLEKIVQSAFDIPPPLMDVLRRELVNAAVSVMGEPPERVHVRFWNVFLDVVAPVIRTPRDVVRITNDLKATWPAVAGEVDRTDFLALSAIKLLRPEIYAAIRANPDALCGTSKEERRDDELKRRYDTLLTIDRLADDERLRWRRALRRLFPRLDSVWSNVLHSGDDGAQRDRLVSSSSHFPTYFSFSLSQDILPAGEIAVLIERAGDAQFVEAYLRLALGRSRRDGSTQAPLVLEELMLHADEVPAESVTPLLAAIFAMADELDLEVDRKKGFLDIGDNPLRIHWLCNRLVTERFELDARDAIYLAAAQQAPLTWLVDFANRCQRYFEPPTDGRSAGDRPLVTEATAAGLIRLSQERLRQAAEDGTLVASRKLARLLFDWQRHSSEGAAEVRRWTDAQLGIDAFVVAMANETTSISLSQGMGFDGDGDRVARQVVRVNFKPYRDILDCDRLETRVDEVLVSAEITDGERQILSRFKTAPRGSHD